MTAGIEVDPVECMAWAADVEGIRGYLEAHGFVFAPAPPGLPPIDCAIRRKPWWKFW